MINSDIPNESIMKFSVEEIVRSKKEEPNTEPYPDEDREDSSRDQLT